VAGLDGALPLAETTTLPFSSARICTSTWRTEVKNFFQIDPAVAEGGFGFSEAVKKAFLSCSAPVTRRMPLPPPPERALMSKG
jgi:hypothetical protein